MTELPRTVVHRAAHRRARSEMFRPFRFGVDELAKALAGDDADALSADEPKPRHTVVSCPTCGFIATPVAVERHRRRTGHGGRPERDDTNNYAHADDRDSLNKAALVGVIAATPEKRHTLVAVTPDQFGTDPQSFQHRVWKSRIAGHTKITEGGRLLGRVVEITQWPFPGSTSALQKAGDDFLTELPADSYYVGVVWEPKAWADVQAGRLSPAAVVAGALTA
jgi:hypothetical protein